MFLLYDAPDTAQVQVVVKDETIWMTQKAMSMLFDVDKSSISRHLKHIFESGELTQETTVAKIATVVNRGIRGEVTEELDFYNLDMIISVGYRVNSTRATRFRQWATKILEGRILKSDVTIAKNYLDEKQIRQLERAVTGYFDYIEDLIERENTFNIQQFAASVNEFLSFRRYNILPDRGQISKAQADEKAEKEYDIFNRTQPITSDFDQEIKLIIEQNSKQ